MEWKLVLNTSTELFQQHLRLHKSDKSITGQEEELLQEPLREH